MRGAYIQIQNPETKSTKYILEQWKVCVEAANATSQRRDSMNNLFASLNLAILAAISFTWNMKSLVLLVAGTVLCIVWIIFIKNYKLLNQEKFNVINSLECSLERQSLNDEWEALKKCEKYKDATWLERIMPIAFVLIYITVMVIIICSFGGK